MVAEQLNTILISNETLLDETGDDKVCIFLFIGHSYQIFPTLAQAGMVKCRYSSFLGHFL